VVRADYTAFCDSADRDLSPKWAVLRSCIEVKALGQVQRSMAFRLEIGSEGLAAFHMEMGNEKTSYTCALQ
jgi:hypothetical protein